MNQIISVSPAGEKFPLPKPEDYRKEFETLKKRVEQERAKNREIVVVMGVGFVGAVMAAIVADTVDKNGQPTKFVIGMQRPSVRSYWKIPLLNRGVSPVKAEDPEVDPMIARCVKEKKTLIATYTYDVLKLADVVVVDVQCDYIKEDLGNVRTGNTDMAALEASIGVIAEHIQPDTLVLIETTVAPGTTEQVAYPIMKKIFRKRKIKSDPLLAHSYERVMPGRDYVASIRDFWRVCSGINEEAKRRVVKFLNEVLNTEKYPLTVMDRPIESETDLIKVIQAIKVRPTHSNIIFPGPGIGGYCLPKDGGLGVWAYKHILGFEDRIFRITPMAININDTRGLHVGQLTRDALRNMGQPIASSEILVLGAAYREDVGDTRYSGSEIVIRKLAEMGAEIRVHDPYVEHWWEFEQQDSYPAAGQSKAKFFRNQEKLKEIRIEKDLNKALKGAEAVIFAVRHAAYLDLDPDKVVKAIGQPAAIIDCFGVLTDDKISRYFELGCEVKGLGRGHIQRIKDQIRKT